MSIRLMSQVWEIELDRGQRDVLLVMADHADDDGVCWPSNPLIAWKTDQSKRNVQRIINGLTDAGLVRVLRNQLGGRGRSKVYELHLEKGVRKSPFTGSMPDDLEEVQVTKGDARSSSFSQGNDDSPSPFAEPERVTSGPRKGDIAASKGDTAMSPEPSKESGTTRSRPTSSNAPESTKQPKPRKRDEIWDALVALGLPSPTNDNERGKWNKACRLLRQSGATPEDIRIRAGRYRQEWETRGIRLTPLALANNWSHFAPIKPRQQPLTSWIDGELCPHNMPPFAVCDECEQLKEDPNPRSQLPRRAVSCRRPGDSDGITIRTDRVHPGQLELLTEGVWHGA